MKAETGVSRSPAMSNGAFKLVSRIQIRKTHLGTFRRWVRLFEGSFGRLRQQQRAPTPVRAAPPPTNGLGHAAVGVSEIVGLRRHLSRSMARGVRLWQVRAADPRLRHQGLGDL